MTGERCDAGRDGRDATGDATRVDRRLRAPRRPARAGPPPTARPRTAARRARVRTARLQPGPQGPGPDLARVPCCGGGASAAAAGARRGGLAGGGAGGAGGRGGGGAGGLGVCGGGRVRGGVCGGQVRLEFLGNALVAAVALVTAAQAAAAAAAAEAAAGGEGAAGGGGGGWGAVGGETRPLKRTRRRSEYLPPPPNPLHSLRCCVRPTLVPIRPAGGGPGGGLGYPIRVRTPTRRGSTALCTHASVPSALRPPHPRRRRKHSLPLPRTRGPRFRVPHWQSRPPTPPAH